MWKTRLTIICMIFLVLFSSSAVYAQSWGEDPQVEVIVTDSHGQPLEVARTGQKVQIQVEAWMGDHYHLNPEVDISTYSPWIQINPETAKMTYDDPKDPLAVWYLYIDYQFLSYDPEGFWVWDLDKINNEGLPANTLATLVVNALLTNPTTERITINTELVDVFWLGLGDISHIDVLVDTDSYSFDTLEGVEPIHHHQIIPSLSIPNRHSIPMQPTGIPLIMGLLGISSIIVGFFSKKE